MTSNTDAVCMSRGHKIHHLLSLRILQHELPIPPRSHTVSHGRHLDGPLLPCLSNTAGREETDLGAAAPAGPPRIFPNQPLLPAFTPDGSVPIEAPLGLFVTSAINDDGPVVARLEGEVSTVCVGCAVT